MTCHHFLWSPCVQPDRKSSGSLMQKWLDLLCKSYFWALTLNSYLLCIYVTLLWPVCWLPSVRVCVCVLCCFALTHFNGKHFCGWISCLLLWLAFSVFTSLCCILHSCFASLCPDLPTEMAGPLRRFKERAFHRSASLTSTLVPLFVDLPSTPEMRRRKLERYSIMLFLERLLTTFDLVVTVQCWWCRVDFIDVWLCILTFWWYCTTAHSLSHSLCSTQAHTHTRARWITVWHDPMLTNLRKLNKRGHWIEMTSNVHDIMGDVRRLQPSLVVKHCPPLVIDYDCNSGTSTPVALVNLICLFSTSDLWAPWMFPESSLMSFYTHYFIIITYRFLPADVNLLLSLFQSGRLDSHYPKVCGHQGKVLDIKWNPFFENIIASCSEDASVSVSL